MVEKQWIVFWTPHILNKLVHEERVLHKVPIWTESAKVLEFREIKEKEKSIKDEDRFSMYWMILLAHTKRTLIWLLRVSLNNLIWDRYYINQGPWHWGDLRELPMLLLEAVSWHWVADKSHYPKLGPQEFERTNNIRWKTNIYLTRDISQNLSEF